MGDTGLADEGRTVADRRPVARWRRIVCAVLVVLVCILVPVSVLGVWLHGTVLDTDQYVDTVAPLADDPAVQEAIATRVTNSFVASTDLEARLADVLPARVPVSASAVADGIERFVHDLALRLVQSDQFATIWERANRRAHTQLVAVLQGKGRGNIETKNGQVVVHLGPVVDRVKAALEKVGVNAFSRIDAERVNNQIVLLDSDQLDKAQDAVDLSDKLAIVLPILTIVLFAGAVLVSGNRRRTILRTGLGVAFAVGLVLTAFNIGRSVYLDALGPTSTTRRPQMSTTSSWVSSASRCGPPSCSGSSSRSVRGWPGRANTPPRSVMQRSGSSAAASERPTPSRQRSRPSSRGIAARCGSS